MEAFPELVNQWGPWLLVGFGATHFYWFASERLWDVHFKNWQVKQLAQMSPAYREMAMRELEERLPPPERHTARDLTWAAVHVASGLIWFALR